MRLGKSAMCFSKLLSWTAEKFCSAVPELQGVTSHFLSLVIVYCKDFSDVSCVTDSIELNCYVDRIIIKYFLKYRMQNRQGNVFYFYLK